MANGQALALALALAVTTQAVSCGSVAIHEWSHAYTNGTPSGPAPFVYACLIRGWRRQAEQLLFAFEKEVMPDAIGP
ncbi:MAG: hypothetical protein Kow0063_31770 [Anaerolineae bacterium]